MEQNHLDIFQKALKLKDQCRAEADNFIEANKDANIAMLIQNKQCDSLIFRGGFFISNERLMAYIIADSIIRHKAGNMYLNRCSKALHDRVKLTKYYIRNPTIFTNIHSLILKCLMAYNSPQPAAPKKCPAKKKAPTAKQLKRIEEYNQRNRRITAIPTTYSNGFTSVYREQVLSKMSPDNDYEYGLSDID